MKQMLIRTIALAILMTSVARAQPEPRWIELGAEGTIIARAITVNAKCPAIAIDGGAPQPMSVRAKSSPPNYGVTTCSAVIPPSAVTAAIAGQSLALPKTEPQTIAVIGDTGCRLKGVEVQACNDPKAWPFATVSAQIAAMHPDLVIHVGDFHYRETACPFGVKSCAGPSGQKWDVWNADFFAPAAPLLRAAPWVMVRGNHEDCKRAGEGWFRFLDAGAYQATCRELTEPMRIPAGAGLDLIVLDVADGKDPMPVSELQLDKVHQLARGDAWLVLHRPIWWQKASRAGAEGGKKDDAPPLPSAIQMVLSGHVHSFGVLNFRDSERSSQFVVGDGGTALDTTSLLSGSGGEIYGQSFDAQEWKGQFGFAMLVRKGGGWEGTGYDPEGKPFAVCRITGRSIRCDKQSTN